MHGWHSLMLLFDRSLVIVNIHLSVISDPNLAVDLRMLTLDRRLNQGPGNASSSSAMQVAEVMAQRKTAVGKIVLNYSKVWW